MVLSLILAGLALLSLALMLWQWALAIRFPLHQRRTSSTRTPPVTLLKPLKGSDRETERCLRSWFAQDYPQPTQILFGVAAADDPVCDIVRRLQAEYPQCNAQLVICSEDLGANAKVSTLIQLDRVACHDIVIISDADVQAPTDLISQMMLSLQEPDVGVVNCFYQMANESNLAMRWETFAVNADFWSQVLQAQTLKPLDFALGAVMAVPRTQLARIGGFSALADFLADDYQLGHRIAHTGGRVVLCPVVVECRSAPMRWCDVWRHQVRWARTIRFCQPVSYFLSTLYNPTLWPLLWLLLRPSLAAASVVGAAMAVRMVSGFYCERKLTRRARLSSLWMAPVKDLLQVLIWLLAFAGNDVIWLGQRYRVQRGGKLARKPFASREKTHV